jgi:metallophosphoesterase (TIGR00282 family)
VRVLVIGDVVGRPGRQILKSALRHVRRRFDPDLIIANGENCAGGVGMTPSTVDELFRAGCDVITGGNHTWHRDAILPYLEDHDRVLRPANYPDDTPGRGAGVYEARDGTSVAVVNLQGRVFMQDIDDPFRTADSVLAEVEDRSSVVVVDFHAEATSEKVALGWYLDGRVTAVVGTHTHVPTADARVLPGGTAYVTDVGMTGPYDSVIGVEKDDVLARFLTQRPVRFRIATGDARLSAVLIEVSAEDGLARSVRRVEYPAREDRGSS